MDGWMNWWMMCRITEQQKDRQTDISLSSSSHFYSSVSTLGFLLWKSFHLLSSHLRAQRVDSFSVYAARHTLLVFSDIKARSRNCLSLRLLLGTTENLWLMSLSNHQTTVKFNQVLIKPHATRLIHRRKHESFKADILTWNKVFKAFH